MKNNRCLISGYKYTQIFYLSFLTKTILTAGFILSLSTAALAVEGLPGAIWGNIGQSDNSATGSSYMGWVNQGIDWVTLPGGIKFNTYAEYRYRLRDKQKLYYNAHGPALGFEFKKAFLRLGMDYYWERFPEQKKSSNYLETYLAGFYDWDLNKKAKFSGIKGLPGAVWFNLSHNINSLTGSGAMGWINQGIDWVTLPGDIKVNSFGEYRFRFRDKEKQYYNAHGPALGFEFKKAFLRLGMDYYWERFPAQEQNKKSNHIEIYLTWYYDWDLKPKKK